MTRVSVGYIKLHRKIVNSSVWCDADKLKLWLLCLMKANHSESSVLVNGKKIELEEGQFVTGRDSLTKEFNLGVPKSKQKSKISIYKYLISFAENEMLNIKSTNKYSIITILNWNDYQQNEQQENINRTSTEHQPNTDKNDKNVKNDNNKDIREKSKRFIPPTLDEVRQYCLERNNTVDANKFVDFYQSKNWYVGKNKMKDWKAAVRTWESSDKKETPNKSNKYNSAYVDVIGDDGYTEPKRTKSKYTKSID